MKDIYKWLFGARGRATLETPGLLGSLGHDLELPEDLVPFKAAINATRLPILGAMTQTVGPVHAAASQLGGRPWWPTGMEYPVDKHGNLLYLLIQINLADAPKLSGFPDHGLLQMFLGAGELYGANFDDLLEPSGFRCIYHADVTLPRDTRVAPKLPPSEGYFLPLESPLTPIGLSFVLDEMPVDCTDYRFETLLPEIGGDEDLIETYAEWCMDEAGGRYAIRLGGYPSFTQEDPRSYQSPDTIGTTTLLTIDTTDGIMWGDAGVAQFFIRPEDLAARDFSRVAYNWDCC